MAPDRTRVTFKVANCQGCVIRLYQVRDDETGSWGSNSKTVRDGAVTFDITSNHTEGLVATVRAPWEGEISAVTTVVFRYAKLRPGTNVSFSQARAKTRGSACWAGSDADAVTIPLTIKKVTVRGLDGPVDGSIAYAKVTQDWWQPMQTTNRGVLATQDAIVCQRP